MKWAGLYLLLSFSFAAGYVLGAIFTRNRLEDREEERTDQ